jgi:CheY-like chemotaxis protein
MQLALQGGVLPQATSADAKTVLLVEDDADVRDEIAAALERGGYRVVAAAHGLDALELLHASPVPPALILLDWMMPVMDGMEFLSHVASDPQYTSIPIVVVSAVAKLARIPSLCVAAVMAKPVRVRTLLDVVDRLCGSGGTGPGGGLFEDGSETGDHLIGRPAIAS